MTSVTTVLNVRRVKAGRKRLEAEVDRDLPTGGNVPRIARLMALAIKFRGMLDRGDVKDISELARLARVSQPRMTQIMNLMFLAPDIQERLLVYTGSYQGVNLRGLQPISNLLHWSAQREIVAVVMEAESGTLTWDE